MKKISDLMQRYHLLHYLRENGLPTDTRKNIRCPFPDHKDSSPSFRLYPEGRFCCFGCGRKGNVIDFIMYQHSCDRDRALEIYRQAAGGVTVARRETVAHRETVAQASSPVVPDQAPAGQAGNSALHQSSAAKPIEQNYQRKLSTPVQTRSKTESYTPDQTELGQARQDWKPVLQFHPSGKTEPVLQFQRVYQTYYELLSVDDKLKAFIYSRHLPESVIEQYGFRSLAQPKVVLREVIRQFGEDIILASGLAQKGEFGVYPVFGKPGIVFPGMLNRDEYPGLQQMNIYAKNPIIYLSMREYEQKQFRKLNGVMQQYWFYPAIHCTADGFAVRQLSIFESILDAVSYGQSHPNTDLLALGGAAVKDEYLLRLCRDYQSIYLCLDNDPAGKALTARLQKLLTLKLSRKHVKNASLQLTEYKVKDWNEFIAYPAHTVTETSA